MNLDQSSQDFEDLTTAEIEDFSAGRWWWENPDTKECGLHVNAATKV